MALFLQPMILEKSPHGYPFHLFRRFLPVGFIAGVGLLMFSSFAPVATHRVDSFGVDLTGTAMPSLDSSQTPLARFPEDPTLVVRVTLDWSQIEIAQGSTTGLASADRT